MTVASWPPQNRAYERRHMVRRPRGILCRSEHQESSIDVRCSFGYSGRCAMCKTCSIKLQAISTISPLKLTFAVPLSLSSRASPACAHEPVTAVAAKIATFAVLLLHQRQVRRLQRDTLGVRPLPSPFGNSSSSKRI